MYYNRERKRVACVIPPYYRLIESKNNRLQPAMHYIAEILYRRGHEVTFINGDYIDDSVPYADRVSLTKNSWLFDERYANGHESYEEVIEALREFKPEIVFLSAGDVLMPTVEMGSTQSCAYLAKRIKEEFGEQVVCVGYGHLLKYAKKEQVEHLDAVITSEGEEYALKIVEDGATGNMEMSWCEDLDQLPILTGHYLYHKAGPEDWDYIMSMRGCPNRCTFCHQPSLRGYNVSTMSPERFVRELRYRIEEFGTKGFYFSDTIFLPNMGKRTMEMLDRLIQLKKDYPDFNWWAESRVDTMADKAIMMKMKESGCRHLKFGVEMTNQDMLNTVKKGITLAEVENVFRLTKECGIERTSYVLLGCPGFKDQDYKDMWQFFKDLEAENYVININVPYIGTQIYKQMKDELNKYGIMRDGEESFIHTSLTMQQFWGISDETLQMYFSLQGKKDDAQLRKYQSKIVDRDIYEKDKIIVYK